MKVSVLLIAALAVFIACGCLAATDEAVGIWENKSLPFQEMMKIKADGTFIISSPDGNEMSSGTWRNTGDRYEFLPGDGGPVYAEIVHGGRGQVFLMFENVTYLKL